MGAGAVDGVVDGVAGAGLSLGGGMAGLPFVFTMWNSTLRFFSRPSGLSLATSGRRFPKPFASRCSAGITR